MQVFGVLRSGWVWFSTGIVFLAGAFTLHPLNAPLAPNTPDLAQAIITIDDLPAGFTDLPEAQKKSMESLLKMMEGQFRESAGIEILNFTGFSSGDPQNPQVLISGLLSPLSPANRVQVDRGLADPDEVIEGLKKTMGAGDQVERLDGAGNIGSSRLAFALFIQYSSAKMRMDYIVARRGPVLVEVAMIYQDGKPPSVNPLDIARLLDQRVAAVVGEEAGISFRTAGPLTPELTTAIPTPWDISTRPEVLGANLLLAALFMLPFAVAAEVFTRTLTEHEGALRARLRPLDWIGRLQGRLDSAAQTTWGARPFILDFLKVLGVMLFYGLVFSLLDRTWNPFSPAGVVLFVSMTVAYGLVGIADDIVQWRAIRRWGMDAVLAVRPANVLMALLSTAASRLLWMVPGLMFGTPEALQADEEKFDPVQRAKLTRISVTTFMLVGLGSWSLTAGTTIFQRVPDIAQSVLDGLAGLEAFLLVLFAVALENMFVQMLGFPGGFGNEIKKRSRGVWLFGLLAVTFVFYHTLINPAGELAEALQKGNIRLFFGISSGFMLFAFGLRGLVRTKREPAVALAMPQAAGRTVGSPIQEIPAPAGAPQVIVPRAPVRAVIKPPDCAPPGGNKTCPVCAETIKAQAKICRFCHAAFAVQVRGYCLREHALVMVDGNSATSNCPQCSGDLVDLHIESRLIGLGAGLETTAHPLSAPAEGLVRCVECGEYIKAQAKICRFCRAKIQNNQRETQ